MAVTAADVRALDGAICRPVKAGGAVAMGQAVYDVSDGDWELTDANVALASAGKGIVVAVNDPGETTAADGDAISVCTFGPVGGFSSLTPGKLQYIGETAGALVETAPTGAGTWTFAIGYAEDTSTVFVMPGLTAPVSNS